MEHGRSLTWAYASGAACVAAFAIGTAVSLAADIRADGRATSVAIPAATQIEAYRRNGDLPAQRRYAWDAVSRLQLINTDRSLSRAWHRSDEVFAPASSAEDALSNDKTTVHGGMMQSGEPQVMIITLYNDAAQRHIRGNKLHERAQLEHLLIAGQADPIIRENRTIPPFPSAAAVLLTAWWPVASDRTTAMPVWDPELNPPRTGGNNYATWQRVVAVDRAAAAGTAAVESMGRRFPAARRVSLAAFEHIVVDQELAERTQQNSHAHKAAVIALGRELRAGDYLALVAIHVAVKAPDDWVWATLWWHDDAQRGAFAQDRPAELHAGWRNYLLDVAFDAELPRAADGGPHAAFNPWLEARFPDGGAGSGLVSNCVACHSRASYPPVGFLPVTRGAPDVLDDPAYAPGRLRTNALWSVARQAR